MKKPSDTAAPDGGEIAPTPRRASDPDSSSLLQAANENLVLAALRAQELAEASVAFRLLVDSVREYAIFMLDPAGLVTTWNAGAVRALGYEAAEVVGRHLSVFYTSEDIVARVCETDLDVASREGRCEVEGIRARKGGDLFRANIIVTALRDPAGALVGFGVVTHDLTERIRMEEARLELARGAEAEKLKDEFLAIMGHELRNPLAPMVAAVHLLKARKDPYTERELAVLDRQLSHMMRLVDDLLDISRSGQDKLRLARAPVEIGNVVAHAVEMVTPLIEANGHRLEVEVPAAGLAVDVDRARGAQVFVNLLTNAAKYTPSGGVIRLRAFPKDGEVAVVVEDNGVGISTELMPRIFDLFSQGEQRLHREHGGLGVGLALAHRLVKAHGGEIVAQSDGPGTGSRFIVRLPSAAIPARGDPETAVVAPPTEGARRRILIVDDNQDSAEMLEAVLQLQGHETRVALDGADALALANAVTPDFVILDLGLPDIDGFEVARRMRMLPACATIPIVAVSGYATDGDREKALAAGFTAHFAKPVDIDRLSRAVGELAAAAT